MVATARLMLRPFSSLRPFNITPSPRSTGFLNTRARSPQQRYQSQWPFPNRSQHSYQRFGGSNPGAHWLYRWAAHPHFYRHIGGITVLGAGLYVANLEEVPISHRKRFNIISEDLEESIASQARDETLDTYRGRIVPDDDPRHRTVEHVLARLIPHSGLRNKNWEVYVIDDPQKNAFVVPGGKVFVFTGILPVCDGEDGIATVLSHEISHTVARHSAERMSEAFLIFGIVGAVFLSFGIDPGISRLLLDVGFSRPGSRTQEAEADYMGLLMMSEACFDPRSAVRFWERMQQMEQVEPPQFLSTHPSHANRAARISDSLGKAVDKYETSDCGATSSWARDFNTRIRWD